MHRDKLAHDHGDGGGVGGLALNDERLTFNDECLTKVP